MSVIEHETPLHMRSAGVTPENIVKSDLYTLPENLTIRAEKVPLHYYDSSDAIIAQEAETHCALVDPSTQKFLGIVSKSYKVVDHIDIAEVSADALTKGSTGINIDGLEVKDYAPDEGRAWIREVTFPEESFFTAGEEHHFRLYIRNSYNQFYSLTLFAGPLRVLCFNGMFTGEAAYHFRHKHTARLDIDVMATKLGNSVHHFREAPDYFKTLQRSSMSRDATLTFLRKTLCAVTSKNHETTYNKSRLDQIMGYYDADDGYQTAWRTVNAMTAWATHQESARADINNVRQRRLEEVHRVTNGDYFKELVAA